MKKFNVFLLLFNILIGILVLLGIIYLSNTSMKCDIVIETNYPFCSGFYNYTLNNSDFYVIKYVRNMYGVNDFNKWSIVNCHYGFPELFLLTDERRIKFPFYYEVFKK